MARVLPKKTNPLISGDAAPAYDELLGRRRLGKTHLAVKATQIGTSNATRPENLGPFEYAHLRAPLPKDLKGSEIFPSITPQQHPETYFLMRRSRDGFVSATGMFKIAFPWAKIEEERSEREHLKSLAGTSEDEIAGNVWISPAFALELAREYHMYDWVRALLDPTDIAQSPSSAKKKITPPPRFDLPAIEAPTQLSPIAARTRRGRSASPSKRAVSPRKPRATRAAKESSTAGTTAANASLQSALEGSVNGTIEESVEVDQEIKQEDVDEKKKTRKTTKSKKTAPIAETDDDEEEKQAAVTVEETVSPHKSKKSGTEQTTFSVDMPISFLPEAPSAEETQQMIAKAKEMVQEASKEGEAAAESSSKADKKRKTDALSDGEEEDEETKTLRTKRAKVLEEKLKKERVRNRALVGVTAAFAFAASIPYFF